MPYVCDGIKSGNGAWITMKTISSCFSSLSFSPFLVFFGIFRCRVLSYFLTLNILLTRLVMLLAFLAVLSILSRTCLPWLLKLMISLSSQVCIFLCGHNHILNFFALYDCENMHMCEWDSCLDMTCVIPLICADQWTLSTGIRGILLTCCLGLFLGSSWFAFF